ncbi:prephenate dehydrogenase [Streptomyces sp. NBC_00576]|uniref:prephenate dehydrogenase n=1 Tax=Streptomyces sp. NBC_00576 TaxID=2903665 RepID=UPI002E800B41|nr:prephenate dehydrogenase [Streptomyces sp. NBC_00576]WUB68692.1 prephenate dehydrogenase [Streptomyces sp. NBC_00576]WUB77004.1 prephenate dehydrogenase [Streptomyces sp. NBC_00576]
MNTTTVIGTGAIGTSVALALTRRGISVHLEDVDRAAAKTAEAMGAGSLQTPDRPVDLAVLAVPPAQVGSVLARVQGSRLARAYVDVASVKQVPHDDVRAQRADPASYIGSHPLAGTERSGPLAARADLFEGRPWVLTPSESTGQDVLNRALELVALCDAMPVVMDAGMHDHAVALVSHAPHLISSLLAARLEHAPQDSVRLSGQGVADVTRIAAGDARLWGDILTSNAAAVADVLDAFASGLGRAIDALRAAGDGDPAKRARAQEDLEELLRQGNRGCARIARKPGARRTELATVAVTISDKPGALAELFTSIGELGVNIEDVRIEHSWEHTRGLVELVVQKDAAAELSRWLGSGGTWAVTRADAFSGFKTE